MVDHTKRRNAVLLTAWGETKTVMAWTRDARCSISHTSLLGRAQRVNAGTMTGEDAVSKPGRFDRHKPVKDGSRVNHAAAKALEESLNGGGGFEFHYQQTVGFRNW